MAENDGTPSSVVIASLTTRATARRSALAACARLVAFGFALTALPSQEDTAVSSSEQDPHPAPSVEVASAKELVQAGERALLAEDPVVSWRTFQSAALAAPSNEDARIGLGRAHLLLGRANVALAYAEQAMVTDPQSDAAMTLAVRARIRARQFEQAMQSAADYTARVQNPSAPLLAAHASALFRVQRTEDAGLAYQTVLERDPMHAEAHLRLGSGLMNPTTVVIGEEILSAVAAMRRGELGEAIAGLSARLVDDPANPVVHRLLGEALLQQRTLSSMAMRDEAFARLRAAMLPPPVRQLPIVDFMPAYAGLTGERRAVVDRAMAMFGSRLKRLIAIGGKHDLLLEVDRTTDAVSRATLRGRRTFDGRVWDDVRGIGGLSAATGIEALDEAAQHGFDTLVHEIAHQVHYYALKPVDQARIRKLFRDAKEQGLCLDYYAATNEAEYFGQGVEAFASLGKRPGGETTHGHTRFELFRVDRALHDFVASIVDGDPLAGPRRVELLQASIEVALRCGRPEDAVVAAGLLPEGELRSAAQERAEAALAAAAAF